ncbi:LacI family DNA-binding transcriptional regulator [Bacillus sp. FJAT-49705]|uniref:LacI family DNA-binding transcriptional regulator n=1 Tax=Cytobacillus citreus TaxID=2833586 RepID=A0ABS5NRH9_9BACI|nr:LacI family DNA-binding transcriptional regulator [Cytobacillus citreus]
MKKNKVTIREVAKEAGVSVATVSRFLNNNSYISEDKEKKIQEVMDRLDYKPNEIARGLAKQKSNTIALIIPDLTNPFFPDLVTAIEQVAKLNGYSLILVNSHEDDLQDAQLWKSFRSRYIDGFILASFQVNEEVLKGLEGSKIPFVRVDRAVNFDSSNSIGVDNYHGAKMAVEHLIEIGCKKIAHISGPKSFSPSIDRVRGYLDTIRRLDKHELILLEGDFSLESGMQLTAKLMKEHQHVDGIFLANDLMALGSLKALKTLNINVPKDVAVIGFDGIKLTEIVEPEITTIEQPIYNIGAAATDKLIRLIENDFEDIPNFDLNVRLIKRESTLGFPQKNK